MSYDPEFRCEKCGAFVSAERGYEADDYIPAPCKRCKNRKTKTGDTQ